MSVDPLFAQWLQREADNVVVTDAAQTVRWGATARTIDGTTGIATSGAAQIQGNRELTFWSRGPFAIDVHQLVGIDWADELGRVVTLSVAQLGYDAGIDVFVFEAEVDRATNMSSVTVLRPIRSLS